MAKDTVASFVITLRDVKGNIGRVKWWLHYDTNAANTGTNVQGIVDLLRPLTNAAVVSSSGPGGIASGVVEYGAESDYEAIEDKAVLVFQALDGQTHNMEIPAPGKPIFLADQRTVDPTQTDMAAFLDEVLATSAAIEIGNKAGSHYVNYVGGYRKMRKLQRKLNIFVRTPDLTPDEPAE